MQFYPHNVPSTSAEFAVSASIARTGSFINNRSAFGATLISTASLALNITGTAGTSGTSYVSTGPTGPQGDRGVTGFRGNNIFLLSSSWHSGTPCTGGACEGPFTLYNIGPGFDECGTSLGSNSYYSNANSGIINSSNIASAGGYILYLDDECTTVAANIAVHNNNNIIFYTDNTGTISTTGCN